MTSLLQVRTYSGWQPVGRKRARRPVIASVRIQCSVDRKAALIFMCKLFGSCCMLQRMMLAVECIGHLAPVRHKL